MKFALGLGLTEWIILLTFAGWIFYTANAMRIGQKTISMALRDMAIEYTCFPFVWGMLITHWFAPKQHLMDGPWGWALGLPVLAILLGIDIYWKLTKREPHWARWPFFYFLLGLPMGYFFWPQGAPGAPF
jgi:hypothetical protein